MMTQAQDYGADPLGNGMFRMVPSGDLVNEEEKRRRLASRQMHARNEILGLTWDELERRQGGKLTRL
jgi:hypothetical protein